MVSNARCGSASATASRSIARGASNAAFQPEQAARARELLANGGVLCAVRSPYDATLVPNTPALLLYSDVPPSLEALAAVLAGERRPTGRLPVRL